MTDIQQKINTWWIGLPDEEREKWPWEQGDMVIELLNMNRVSCVGGIISPVSKKLMLYMPFGKMVEVERKKVTPFNSPQFWWKLFLWVRKAYGTLRIDTSSDTFASIYIDFHRKQPIRECTIIEIALIDAAIAVQEQRGKIIDEI